MKYNIVNITLPQVQEAARGWCDKMKGQSIFLNGRFASFQAGAEYILNLLGHRLQEGATAIVTEEKPLNITTPVGPWPVLWFEPQMPNPQPLTIKSFIDAHKTKAHWREIISNRPEYNILTQEEKDFLCDAKPENMDVEIWLNKIKATMVKVSRQKVKQDPAEFSKQQIEDDLEDLNKYTKGSPRKN